MSAEFEKKLTVRFGPKWKKHQGSNGLEYRVCCPFCPRVAGKKADTGFKLHINPGKGAYNCFRCGDSGTLYKLKLSSKVNAGPSMHKVTRRKSKFPEPGEVVPLHKLARNHPGRLYLEERGFDTDVLSWHMGVHYCISGREFGNGVDFYFTTTDTLIFPVWMHGKIMGWQSRVLYSPDRLEDSDCEKLGLPRDPEGEWLIPPKYYTPWGMNKGELLYNFDNALPGQVAVVAEGPLDVGGIGMAGLGTFGKGISEIQARLLKEYWDMLIIMLDPGDADNESLQLLQRLQMAMPVVKVDLKGMSDPGEGSFSDIWTQIYDTALARGYDLSKMNLGKYNEAIVRR